MDNTIAKNIKYYRKKMGLTQQELANSTSISLMSIRRYEKGEREPSLSSLNEIAKALQIEVWKLYQGQINIFTTTAEKEFKNSLENRNNQVKVAISTEPELIQEEDKPILGLFHQLNDDGQDRAIEQVELLTKIPEYQKNKE